MFITMTVEKEEDGNYFRVCLFRGEIDGWKTLERK